MWKGKVKSIRRKTKWKRMEKSRKIMRNEKNHGISLTILDAIYVLNVIVSLMRAAVKKILVLEKRGGTIMQIWRDRLLKSFLLSETQG